MTDTQQGATGSPEQNQQANNEQQQSTEGFISKSDAEKLAAELKKYKSIAEDFQNKFKNQELEAAKAANDWQKVAEHRQKELDEMLSKFDGFKKAVVQDKRLTAIREEAMKSGLRKESLGDLGYLDYPEVKLQTDDEGNFKVEGADKAIQRLKTTRPHWFTSGVPNVNLNSPSVTGDSSGKLKYEDIKKLEAEYKKNPNASNEAKFKAAILEFRKQSAAN